jgi:hypothetical protein
MKNLRVDTGSFSAREVLDLCFINARYPGAGANPKPAKIVFQNLSDIVVGQAFTGRESGNAPVPQSA